MSKNIIYIIKMISQVSPGRLSFFFVKIVLDVSLNVILNIFMLRFIINSIENSIPFNIITKQMLIIALFLVFVYVVDNLYNEWFAPKSNQKISQHLKKMVFYKAAEVDLACYENPEYFDTYIKAVKESELIVEAVLSTLEGVFSSGLMIFTVSIFVFTVDLIFMLLACIPFILTLLFGKKLNKLKFNYKMDVEEKIRRRDYIKRVLYLPEYAKELRTTSISNVLFCKYSSIINEIKQKIKYHGFKISKLDYVFMMVQDVIVYSGTIIYAAFKYLVLKTLSFSNCVVIINSIRSLSSSLQGIIDKYMSFYYISLQIDVLFHFMNYESKVDIHKKGITDPKLENKSEIRIENVSFRYEGQKKYSLKNINITIHKNEKVAIVGYNGSGKTTLIKLLLRLYDVNEGEIKLNDINIKDYDLQAYRDIYGTVLQDFKVFSLSIYENILLKNNATKQELTECLNSLKKSGVYERIEKLPQKMDTVLTKEFNDDGIVLSGGENQKLAIARVFAKKSDVIILDEPSSALDPISEYNIYHEIMETFSEKTVIFISHRLSTTILADKIYVMDSGKIVERGTHSELLEMNGKYKDMWSKQAEKYTTMELHK